MAHYTSNINLRQRLIQIMVLSILIIAGILFAQPADAMSPPKNRVSKSKLHTSTNRSNKACYELYKKRTSNPKRSMFASNPRLPKYKAMAETDAPGSAASAE